MSEQSQTRREKPTQDVNRIELMPASFTMRVGNRRLTMSWRPRKPVPQLLTGLLRRSWRAMFGKSLRMSVTAAAICAAWNVPALAAAPGVNTLPTGGVITAGTATIAQNGNTLNINQSSSAAIGSFTSFSIGANAVVDISQTSASNAFLARVTGADPSQIYGLLKSNGTVVLVNQNGLMVGPGGVVDVARFIGSTLNISDSDFLAGRLTFVNGGHAGNVDNQGVIKSATGGSVYLIGANVTNNGIIHSPNGEVLLAAGQTVQLVDTATPGVTVCVTGAAGSVTNLGAITAEAGRIGIAAGLITNSGNINASSVVNEGGRIFLRASQKLTTTASSRITADGVAKGGSVVLYSDGAAYIDGDVSARGAPGLGGFVETSGKKTLDVVKAPDVGTGGEWLIDPYDLTVVATGTNGVSNSGNVITSTAAGSTIEAGTIVTQLNQGNSVSLTTGAGGAANGGNITVNAAINKTSGSAASLTLNANNSIAINAGITSTSGTLNLNLNSNLSGIAGDHAVQVNNALIQINGGELNVRDGSSTGISNGNLFINNGGGIDLGTGGTLNAGNLNVTNGGNLLGGFTSSVHLQGTLNNSGTVNFSNAAITVGDKIINNGQFTTANVSINTVNGFINSVGAVANLNYMTNFQTGSFINAGTMNANGSGGFVTFENGLSNSGVMNIQGSIMSNASSSNGVGGIMNLGVDGVTTHLQGSGDWTNDGTLKVLGTLNTVNIDNALTNGATGTILVSGSVNTLSAGTFTNAGSMIIGASNSVSGNSVTNTGNISMTDATLSFNTFTNDVGGNLSGTGTIYSNGQFTNSGVISPGGDGTVGQLGINGNFTQSATGVLNIDVASDTSYDTFYLNAPTPVQLGGTLQSKLLGAYVPTLNTRLSPIVFTNQNAGETYFRHVLGNVINTSSGLQMLKVDYKGALALVMSGSANLTYNGNSDSHWGTATSWTEGILPTAIDNVIVNNGVTLTHGSGDGVDTVNSITLNNSSTLAITGGTVNAGNITSAGYGSVIITGTAVEEGGGGNFNGFSSGGGGVTSANTGVLNLSGTARISNLSLSNGGTFNGGSSSVLNVTDDFSQNSAGVINSNGTVALSRADGDLVTGNIAARNLVLEAQNGAISQSDSSLHVTQQLLTSSATGTTLTSSGNRIAAFAGNNRGINDISLVNNLELADTSVFRINGVTNANGSISIVNTGGTMTTALGSSANFLTALPTAPDVATPPTLSDRLGTLGIVTNGTVSASMLAHTVVIETHSPLTIGVGGVSASGNINLTAGNSGSPTDNLIVNGVIASAGGSISLVAGNNMSINANISTSAPGTALFTVTNGVLTYAPGVSVTDASGTVVPVAALVNQIVAPVVTPVIQPSVAQIVTNTVKVTTTGQNIPTPPVFTASTTPVSTPANTQTTGGTQGSFGGDDGGGSGTPAAGGGANTAKKPLPVCT
ncbi:hypothetical protein F506_00330 [Herbaspirillum hiltneri N3]|uniref:Filamentous haemagglutinin FhaB/tRNA nuclease CdiA-like TPS domain-containing protein n=2 Tax=Herbaspirillum TaxID=963 RepID=A0ABM5UVT2_9BURK|nr:hypothetical protein F506_00330 [Herbaspirillum hiltneri N3]